jgi:hypothetical protein
MNEALALTAIAVMVLFCLWILIRLAKQQRDGTIHQPEDEQLREDADTRDIGTRLVDIPWREDGHHPGPGEPLPAVAAPDAITEPAVVAVQDEAAAGAEGTGEDTASDRGGTAREPGGATEAGRAGYRPTEGAKGEGAKGESPKDDGGKGEGAKDGSRAQPASPTGEPQPQPHPASRS